MKTLLHIVTSDLFSAVCACLIMSAIMMLLVVFVCWFGDRYAS